MRMVLFFAINVQFKPRALSILNSKLRDNRKRKGKREYPLSIFKCVCFLCFMLLYFILLFYHLHYYYFFFLRDGEGGGNIWSMQCVPIHTYNVPMCKGTCSEIGVTARASICVCTEIVTCDQVKRKRKKGKRRRVNLAMNIQLLFFVRPSFSIYLINI